MIDLRCRHLYPCTYRVDVAIEPAPALKPCEETNTMAALAVLGGLVGGAMILATIRSKHNAKKATHIQTFKIK
jgi:hypothetical protein